MPKEAVIQIRNVTIGFQKLLVLNNINLDIIQGEIFGIVGMSGSGKTTLLNTLAGVLDPLTGNVFYKFPGTVTKKTPKPKSEFKRVSKNQIKVRKQFGFSAQDPSFYMKLTVKENLTYFSSMYGLPKTIIKQNINTVMETVGLDHCQDFLSERLSGGMKKRLDIACAMVHNPEVLILDEPTSDLDPLLRAQMLNLIKKINLKGTTIIIASHFLKDMEKLCTRIGVLYNKQLGVVGTPDYIRGMYTKNDEIHLETIPGKYEEIVRDLKKVHGLKIQKIINQGHKLIIYTPESINVLQHLLQIIKKRKEHLIDIDVAKPTLREVFESLVKGKNE